MLPSWFDSGSAVSVKMAVAQVVCCLFLVVSSSLAAISIPDTCLRCLCESTSGILTCPFDTGCHNGVCGPFAITLPYWQDAGRPTVALDDRNTVDAYEKCALDSTCATATIRGYMNKFHQDCNKDGIEDCIDYAHIHFHGGYGCDKPLSVPVRNTLANCMQRLAQPELPSSEPPFNPIEPSPQPFPTKPEDPEYPDNEIIFKEPTTYPSIDVRLKDDE